ncbi:MAG: hypothetical protein LBE81_09910 [Azonexus sp.]|uniref:hypothetical protein n=1 Tax=Azonexus sp. TaxID=1872668 RepID=UPI00281C4110|nr:hypothetical protein [Azonexus sp.]MDR0776934.1 hypothetical protein [Azonexus sp.]
MNAYLLLLIELTLAIAVSLAALRVLSRPLVDLLRHICPGEQAAVFWQSCTKVMLLLAPLLLVLGVDQMKLFDDPLDSLRLALIAALGGLLLALHVVGKRLGRFVVVPPAMRSES